MLFYISWLSVLALLAFWSLSIWLTHALVAWSMSGVGALAGQPLSVESLAMPEFVALWVPADVIVAIKSAAAMAAPFFETALAALPSVAGWLSPLAWGVWGFGALALVVIGAVLHAIIFTTRKAACR